MGGWLFTNIYSTGFFKSVSERKFWLLASLQFHKALLQLRTHSTRYKKNPEKFTVPFAFKTNDVSPNRKENSVEGRHLWCLRPSKCADKHVV